MPLELWIAGAIMVSLTLYALGGGADFGGGVWDLLARGPRAARQRELIAHAIGPIWEANHVWLILVVVLLFVCFPVAWAAISTSLHVPLTLLLVGIVLRGAAFTFRSYGDEDEAGAQRWGRVFAGASVVSPVMLGTCVGAIAGGGLRVGPDGVVRSGFVEPSPSSPSWPPSTSPTRRTTRPCATTSGPGRSPRGW
jgi:cytochrome d ubiquinol oxidase subunit II